MNKIKEIVDTLGIDEKREIRNEMAEKINAVSCMMRDLEEVSGILQTYLEYWDIIAENDHALYLLDCMEQELLDNGNGLSLKEIEIKYKRKIRQVLIKHPLRRNINIDDMSISELRQVLIAENEQCESYADMYSQDSSIIGYNILREDYDRFMEDYQDYYKTINTDFRLALSSLNKLPNIFLYQGVLDSKRKLKLSRHIILSDACEEYIETPNIVAYPIYEIKSKRNARKFYNQTSFKYLEQLSQDYDFDIKTKKLGKLEIR